MAVTLPDDVLFLIAAELGQERDFDTLFSCALAGRRFAVSALTSLYREHNHSPIRGGGSEAAPIAQQVLAVQKWSILWRSIVASSMGHTMYPYCRYLRVLDLRDLTNLLEDEKFRGKVVSNFFAAPLTKFNISTETPSTKRPERKFVRLNVNAILDAIGEAVTEHTPMLELVSGKILPSAMVRWAPRLPKLQALELFDGETLGEELARAAIHANCPNFNSLMIFFWQGTDRDHKLSGFIGGMRPNSLRSLEIIGDTGLGAETFLALNAHSESLKELKLSFKSEVLPHLSLVKGCTALEIIKLEDMGWIDLEQSHNDVFTELRNWLSECESLNELEFANFISAPSLTLPVLLSEKIMLRKLSIDGYVAKDHRLFHEALIHQKSLRSLFLAGDSEAMVRDDIDTLVDSLSQLKELRELELRGVSDYFKDEHIIRIARSLQHLEDLYTTGLELTDDVLEGISLLKNLTSVTFAAISFFTADGLLEFASHLGLGNHGIVFSVDMADPKDRLTEDEQYLVRSAFAEQASGRFEYTLWKDPDISEFEGESD